MQMIIITIGNLMSDYFENKFISPHSLLFLLFFWIALLLFGVSFWQYKEPDSVKGLIFYVSFAVLMIIITYREIEQAKKRIYDRNLLSITPSSFQIDNKNLLLVSDKKFLRLSNLTFWAILILLIPSVISLVYSLINGRVEYNDFIFLVFGLFLIESIFKDIKLIKQRIKQRIIVG